VTGSVASLAANVAVAEPTLTGRIIAAWPPFALTASFELLTRHLRRSTPAGDRQASREVGGGQGLAAGLTGRDAAPSPGLGNGSAPLRELQRQAWRWALVRGEHGRCPGPDLSGA